MSRTLYAKALDELEKQILKMGGLVEEQINLSIMSLANQDLELAENIIIKDDIIDNLELEIEERCLKLIATQQPMAKDLRRISAGLKIITDLERIGDNAVDISKITIRIGTDKLIKPLIDLPRMALITQEMLKNSLDSYINGDVELALTLAKKDDQVDELHSQIFRELISYMFENPKNINQCAHLLFVSRYLERIADHATNIGENVIYMVKAERRSLNN
ncbi:phosphate uptake regulator, PhoU [Desulfonispora thiosulfatigenes DSM 11270]|uniref:Phosphate-specific transport system accessory protein PhoU n=1 Tax=Desulfonispora thiosulfatigenes DSM 11270 TaxID=656914 RepID=A0A1W1VFS7_DESTI|nr:phosphate signaling complex protein PhoU [Desulfonispora thiosulfatigenes]SMB92212.1 phosphate uptake regulator, PhoU [Desulfonispora thiosulfatigenes DSM 11270]